ncbi:MAG: hypothetical protein Q8898_16000 [Bacillota bacterium]|nr:hypothetical protein [Bacillota bacterium]
MDWLLHFYILNLTYSTNENYRQHKINFTLAEVELFSTSANDIRLYEANVPFLPPAD